MRYGIALGLLLAAAVASQVALETEASRVEREPVLWLQSPDVARRLAIGFDAVLADVYWLRAVQFYGDTKLSPSEKKNYDRLYPLLDMTTGLDPRFNIAYRFGAILLSEGYPNGPGTPEQAIVLLEKGIRAMPEKWQYYHDAGFVEYWWRQDYLAASEWFLKASKLPGAPAWLPTVTAAMLARGGVRASARVMWTQLAQTAEQDWLRNAATRGLRQLDAEQAIEQLEAIVLRFNEGAGRLPEGWSELTRAGLLQGTPVDPTGVAYVLDPASGMVDVAPESPLFPLRRERKGEGQV
jgi:tetratricopeptide (TPR) repeat protein